MTDPMTVQQAHEVGQAFGVILSILLIGGAFLVAKNVIKTLLAPVFWLFRATFRAIFRRG